MAGEREISKKTNRKLRPKISEKLFVISKIEKRKRKELSRKYNVTLAPNNWITAGITTQLNGLIAQMFIQLLRESIYDAFAVKTDPQSSNKKCEFIIKKNEMINIKQAGTRKN